MCEKQPYRQEEDEEEEVLQGAKQRIPRGFCQPLEVIMVEQVSLEDATLEKLDIPEGSGRYREYMQWQQLSVRRKG